jgi:hypothetical protein
LRRRAKEEISLAILNKSNFKLTSSIACFTVMKVSETGDRMLKARLSDYQSKHGSDRKYGGIETYGDKWDIENVESERELRELEMNQ